MAIIGWFQAEAAHHKHIRIQDYRQSASIGLVTDGFMYSATNIMAQTSGQYIISHCVEPVVENFHALVRDFALLAVYVQYICFYVLAGGVQSDP